MKAIKITIFFLTILFCSYNSDAQIKDWLSKKKEEAKQKLNAKVDQKSSEAIDKSLETPEKIIKKKVDKKKAKNVEVTDASLDNTNATSNNNNETTKQDGTSNAQPIEVINEAPTENSSTVIQTNIKCDAGKKSIIKILKKQNGVTKTDINIKNGELTIVYSSDVTAYTQLIKLINENGFEADGNPATNKKNSCK